MCRKEQEEAMHNGHNNDLSLLSDYVFELVRCTGLESKFKIELEGEEVEECLRH